MTNVSAGVGEGNRAQSCQGSAGRTLIATSRPNLVSRARYSSPIPPLPSMRSSITPTSCRRGPEMAAHKRFALATDIAVYLCDPRSPWRRGSNKNTNGLLQEYFPKGTNLSAHSQEHLDYIASELSRRPRKTPEFATPAETFNACVASTG